jgi:hypothetical protein
LGLRGRLFPGSELGAGFFFGGEAEGFGGEIGEFYLLDAAKEDAAEAIGGFVVETEVGILFHDIECVAEFVGEFRLRCADGHRTILPGRSIGFLGRFSTMVAQKG